MTKCPICQFDNEDGALFCEQCKSDLSGAQPTTPTVAGFITVPASPVIADAGAASAETVPMAQIEAAPPPGGTPAVAVAFPMPEPPQATPVPAAEPPPAAPMPPLPPIAAIADLIPSDIGQTMSPAGAVTHHAVPPAAPGAQVGNPLPAGAQPRLVVLRGLKINTE